LTGYEDFESLPEDQDFSSMPAIMPSFDPMADNIGDFTAMIGNLDGKGLADHVIGLFETTGYIFKVTDATLAPTQPTMYKVQLTGNGDVHFGVFGAGFHFRNHIFFASNQKGVVMLDKESIDVVNGTATVHYVGDSASLSGNDGMSCHTRMPGFMKRRRGQRSWQHLQADESEVEHRQGEGRRWKDLLFAGPMRGRQRCEDV